MNTNHWQLEIHVVGHCNVRCRGCNHASPITAENFSDSAGVLKSVQKLASLGLFTERVRVLGGEPLLHPELLSILRGIRAAGITKEIHIVTNGLLLSRQPPEFWEAVDVVQHSVYPGLKFAALESAYKQKVRVKEFPRFSETYSTKPHASPQLVQRIYENCSVRKKCGGIVYDGYYYQCSRAPYIRKTLGFDPRPDGLDISTATLDSFLRYAKNDQRPALRACWNCVGSCGKKFDHQFLRGDEWLALQDRPLSEMMAAESLAAGMTG